MHVMLHVCHATQLLHVCHGTQLHASSAIGLGHGLLAACRGLPGQILICAATCNSALLASSCHKCANWACGLRAWRTRRCSLVTRPPPRVLGCRATPVRSPILCPATVCFVCWGCLCVSVWATCRHQPLGYLSRRLHHHRTPSIRGSTAGSKGGTTSGSRRGREINCTLRARKDSGYWLCSM